MNLFDEFIHLARVLENEGARYALVGGVALAFYTQPRFTQDIDLLIDGEDLAKITGILESLGYFESARPRSFQRAPMEIRRFLRAAPMGERMVDLLIGHTAEIRTIIANAVLAQSADGQVRVARRTDLIRLKKLRNSKQDQADIERLEHEDG